MFIKLQPDQVVLFWETIKHGMIMVYKIPEHLQQDFALNALTNLLSGMSQAWVGYDLSEGGDKVLRCTVTTKIVNDKHRGIRYLHVDSLYGYRSMPEGMPAEAFKILEEFARANECKAVTADYSKKRVEEFLFSSGYEKHITTCRKFL